MQSLQLDEQMCLPFMWDSTSPGEQDCTTSPLNWPDHCELWGCFFFWAFLRRCGKGGSRPGRTQRDDKAVKTQKADKLEALPATLDAEDPLREDLQPQLDQLGKISEIPDNLAGARLD